MNVCVFCASARDVPQSYQDAARGLGQAIGEGGHTLVFGGFDTGLMGIVAQAAKESGGRVVGVLPCEAGGLGGRPIFACDELVETRSMAERKAAMIAHADAFVMAPGGFGTLEEFFEVLTLKQLGRHNPAIAILNTNGFYDKLQEFVLSAVEQRFIRSACLNIYALCPTPAATLTYLEQYDPAVLDVRHLKHI